MKTRADWVADADAVLARVRSLLAPYGIAPDERLRIVTDSNPMPGYIHEDRTIAFCPPVIERGADMLRWMFFTRCMGAESLAEAEQFFIAALPVIVSHELSHHLRFSRGLATTSNFVEEQVCNRLGTAIADAIPEFHDAIGPFCEMCGTFADRLEKKFAAAGESVVGESVFVGAVGDALLVAHAVGRRTLDRLEAFAESRDVSSEAIVALAPRVTPRDLADAQASRAGAQRFMDTQYTADPAAYWMLSLRWLHTYFSRPRENRPSLQPVLLEHLLREPDNVAELSMALHAMLASDVASLAFSGDRTCAPALRAAAAAGLLELEGPVAAPVIVERAIQSGEPEEGLVDALGRAWKREETWDPRCLEPLVTVVQNTIGTMTTGALRRFLRLIGLSGIDVVLPIATLRSRAIEDPLLAAEVAAFDASERLSGSEAWISGADVPPELLEAWHAHGRLLSELPAAFLDRCLGGDPSGRVRRALLRMSAGACDPEDDRWAGLALLEIMSAKTADSPADARIAHAIVDSASTDALSAALSRRLPPRGGAEWEALLSFLDRTPEARATLVRIRDDGAAAGRETWTLALRAGAALRDLVSVRFGEDARLDALATEAAGKARALQSLANEIDTVSAAREERTAGISALLASTLRWEAQRRVIEVVRTFVAPDRSAAIGALADHAGRECPPMDDVLAELLLGASPEAHRPALRNVLCGGDDGASDASALGTRDVPAFAVELLATATASGDAEIEALVARHWTGTLPEPNEHAMIIIEKTVHLHSNPLFSGIEPTRLSALAEQTVLQVFKSGDVIFEEGSDGDQLFLILAGRVSVERAGPEGPVVLQVLGPANCFGEMAIFERAPRSATARAESDARLLSLSRRDVMRIGRENPDVYEAFLRVLSGRLRKANEQRLGQQRAAEPSPPHA